MTITEALRSGGFQIGRRDAVLLLMAAMGCSKEFIHLNPQAKVNNPQIYQSYIERCKNGEPIQYIIGEWDFFGHTFHVDKRALIPRPETELLVEEALKVLQPGSNVLDMCTGTGCIAISIALEDKQYYVTGVDISPDVLSLAEKNALRHKVALYLVRSNLFESMHGFFDVIVSNPPYITTAEMEELPRNVADYEPHLALHGGADGMDIYRRLVFESIIHLKAGGYLFLEIGSPEVAEIMKTRGFEDVEIINDYAGRPRIIKGRKPVHFRYVLYD